MRISLARLRPAGSEDTSLRAQKPTPTPKQTACHVSFFRLTLQIIGLIIIGFVFLSPWNINRNSKTIQHQLDEALNKQRLKQTQ